MLTSSGVVICNFTDLKVTRFEEENILKEIFRHFND